ncbi:coiled-coil alpha-helical rod protein 1-like [Thalassophryne amazonica]|uniref:coiled-coil alpha-helical rod protein 1-like n=1 Tax=Thalassophryne amazonica TaxID=390379 RepID=UPI0014715846|nr:coiled-coil alpha-helical rod protein 1-like [Thalassophryne amazonica]
MLTQELKRTPKLIKKALADLHEQYENKFRQQQKELEQSWMEVQQAAAGRDESRRILQQSQEQLEESKVMLEKLHSELLSQQENSERVLRDRVAELEDSCAEKLREMEVDVSTARREHTKAVMTLRHFERQAARKLDQMRKTQLLQSKHTKINDQKKQLKEAQLNVSEGELSDYTTALLHNSADLKDRGEKPSESSCEGVMLHLPVDKRLLSVLEELQTLSAAVINSSEDSTEEEEEHQNSMGPSTTCPHS